MDPRRIWFDPPHLRWGRVFATVLIASTLLGLWVAQRRGLFDEPQNRVVVAAGAAASGVLPRGERNAVPEAAAMVAAAPPAASRVAAALRGAVVKPVAAARPEARPAVAAVAAALMLAWRT